MSNPIVDTPMDQHLCNSASCEGFSGPSQCCSDHDAYDEDFEFSEEYDQDFSSSCCSTSSGVIDQGGAVQQQSELRKRILAIQQDSSIPASEKAKTIQVIVLF